MGNKIGEIYSKKYEEYNLLKLLTDMDNNSINQILLEVYKNRSENITPNNVLNRYINNSDYFCPSEVSLYKTMNYNLLFLNVVPKNYDSLDLSMIFPFGTNSSITKLSQNLMLSSIKNSEVIGDPTTSLTLEACKRRKKLCNTSDHLDDIVDLATVTQVLRMQKFDTSKGYMQHFNLFGLVSCGRKNNKYNFVLEKIKEHIRIWVDLCQKLKQNSFDLGQIDVGITDISFVDHLIDNEFVEREIVNANSFNEYNLFDEQNINIPQKINSFDDLSKETIEEYKLVDLKDKIDYIKKEIIDVLKEEYNDVNFYIEMDRKGGLGYYDGLCFHIYSNKDGVVIPLCDGGSADWSKKLLSDNKELEVASGFGAELVIKLFGKDYKC